MASAGPVAGARVPLPPPSAQQRGPGAASSGDEEDPDVALARLLQDQEHAWFLANGGSAELAGDLQSDESGSRSTANAPRCGGRAREASGRR